MNPDAMKPHGLALRAFFEGHGASEMTIRRDDGVETRLPASHFFRTEDQFSLIEAAAISLCRGRVLDVGAGAGIHALALQSRGLDVTAIDIDASSLSIMAERGVRDARLADVFDFGGEYFDTLLLLGHGIGMVETIDGLRRFLKRARDLVRSGGQMLLDSMDVSRSSDERNLAYHEANRRAGRYIGEVRLRIEHEAIAGPPFGWLHVDRHTLAEHAERCGWACETVIEDGSGEYLARLVEIAGGRGPGSGAGRGSAGERRRRREIGA